MNLRLPALVFAILVVCVTGVAAAVRSDQDPAPPTASPAAARPAPQAVEHAPASAQPTIALGGAGELPGSDSPNVIMPLALLALLGSLLTSASGRRQVDVAYRTLRRSTKGEPVLASTRVTARASLITDAAPAVAFRQAA